MYSRKRKSPAAPRKKASAAKRTKVTAKAPTVTGNVGNRTTLSMAPTPFPKTRWITFDYQNGLFLRSPLATSDVTAFCPNDMFDFDRTSDNRLGNKQPLFYDQLIGSGIGPYKQFYVKSWYTTFTIINRGTAPITVWLTPPQTTAAEVDTVTEVDNLPGVVKKFIDVPGGQSMITISNKGAISDMNAGIEGDTGFTGFANTPAVPVFASVVMSSSANLIYEIAVSHKAYTRLTGVDAVVS